MSETGERKELIETAERLLAAARRAGADAADAVAVRGEAVSVSCRLGKVEEIERSEGADMGLRVFVGKRQAIVSTNRGPKADIHELAARAVAMARAAPEDPTCGLADETLLAHDLPDLDLCDDARPDADALSERAIACEGAGLETDGITNSGGASASCSSGLFLLATSGGFSGLYPSSRHALSCSLLAGEGTGMERDYHYETRTHLAALPDPEEIGIEAAQRTVRRLGARKIKSGTFPVIYEPRTATGLVGNLLSAVSGAAIARKTSFLLEQMGKPVFRPGISIVDDPLRPRGLRSHPFDGEGVAAQRLDIVADGKLASWLLDCASARELGLTTNGHARRGTGGPPSPGASNCHLAAGAVSAGDLLASVGRGLYVTDLMGNPANIVTGDYSRGAAGFWIENGELAHPVSEVTIAGNLRDMFASLTPASDLEFDRAVNAPTVLVEGMTIAGN